MAGPTIAFYGADDPSMFAIEREAMDRSGRVIAALDGVLPNDGRVLDVGAGNGHTAELLTSDTRSIVGLEPALVPSRGAGRTWVKGAAPDLPFATGAFHGSYSTWAYFFPDFHDIGPGLAELDRVVQPGGAIAIVDNAGGDQFCSFTDRKIATDTDVWRRLGFEVQIIETAFEFASIDDARRLLHFFFGPETKPVLHIEFRVLLATRKAFPQVSIDADD